MSDEQPRIGQDVRMNVKVSRRDFPVLTDEICRLPKGRRRTNRLAHLATLGLLWERAVCHGERPLIDADWARRGEKACRPAARGYVSKLPGDLVAALTNDGCDS